MELDDFKNSWQQFSNKNIEQQYLNETQIDNLLKNRVATALKKLENALFLDTNFKKAFCKLFSLAIRKI